MGYPRGFLHGLILGVALGVLFAPQPGAELRRRLQEARREAKGISVERSISVRRRRPPRPRPRRAD